MSETLLIATRKGLFTVTRTGFDSAFRIARTAFLGDRVSQVLIDARDGCIYAALDHGHFGAKLHRSEDGGESFREVALPAFPPKPEGVEDKNSMGKEIPWTVELLWALAAGGADEPGTLWCGTIPGGLFRTRDRGDSWELCESLWSHPGRKEWFGGGYDFPGIHSICVDPRDADRVALAISCGGVWHTRDRGQSWQLGGKGMFAAYMPPERREDPLIQDPHCMVRCAGAPEHLWVQHHNGVFRSSDDGATWKEIAEVTPSNFGFAVAVHPRDPETAWLAPAIKDEHRVPVDGRFVITRTRDGGASWQPLSRGLPQEHSYDLVYRHALAVDDSGEHLAVGSTTGNLWISGDQGDSFVAVSHHLPPIAALAWAP
ncbi:WD40/YVTN/BNR-like repeat-containing protein [Haliangium ochraceum]|uniref:Glycosyl hydrolase BNR repeat-containing protein n=1 Tax=Haliangium ochraceum (strain DSM 14365 / JCM 11303 / SMP-2) TaxID=502025 RepID=D0LNQ3_HALO1|nr:sialidase family protein [Haliangium ochraceum]ACY16958.1 conserved hypothetical protein [Haliangium ochraceum DSM 14365]